MKWLLFVLALIAIVYFIICIICSCVCAVTYRHSGRKVRMYMLYNLDDCNDLLEHIGPNTDFKIIGVDCGLDINDRQMIEQYVTVVNQCDICIRRSK